MKNKRNNIFAAILLSVFSITALQAAVPVKEITLDKYMFQLFTDLTKHTKSIVTSIEAVRAKLTALNTELTNSVDLGEYPKPDSVIPSGTLSENGGDEKISDILQGGITRAQLMFAAGDESGSGNADAKNARKNVELFNMEELLARMERGTHTGKANKRAMIEKADLLYADLFLAIKILKNIENNVDGMDKLKSSLDQAKNGDIFDVAYVNAAINLQNTIALNQLAETIALQTASTLRSSLANQNLELVKHFANGNFSKSAFNINE